MVTNGSIPKWLARYLDQDGPNRIAAAVHTAEESTSGELVPMVVSHSTTTGHVFPLLFLALVCAYLALDLELPFNELHGEHPAWRIVHLLILAGVAWLLQSSAAVRRWLTPGHDIEAQVCQRAALEFHAAGLDRTSGGTGVLLFVSLAERRAVVLADKSIAQKLPPDTWNVVVSIIIQGIRRGDLGQGLVEAIKRCGLLLAPHFPAQAGHANQLDGNLIIKE